MGVQPDGATAERAGFRHGPHFDENRRVDHQRTFGCATWLELSQLFEIAPEPRVRACGSSAPDALLPSSHRRTVKRACNPAEYKMAGASWTI